MSTIILWAFVMGLSVFVLYRSWTYERRIRRATQRRQGGKYFIYLCSPFRGSDERMNVEFARRICRELSLAGAVVFCPHIFFTQFLDDTVEAERTAGITNGHAMMSGYNEVWFALPKWRNALSSGMQHDSKAAEELNRLQRFFWHEKELEAGITKLKADLEFGAERFRSSANSYR